MTDDTTREAPQVRRAVVADGETILHLVEALAAYERLPPPDAAARGRLLADAFGPQPRFRIFLAEAAQLVVGYAFVFETYSTFLALPTLYLEDLFVLPEFRSQGAGYALFMECVQEARRCGCGRMDWAVLDWNALALGFYERLGAQRLADWLLYRLDAAAIDRLLD
jgi:GNAT superfamily N-acetyltransferase